MDELSDETILCFFHQRIRHLVRYSRETVSAEFQQIAQHDDIRVTKFL